MHGEPEQRRENTDLNHDPKDGGGGCSPDGRMRLVAAGIEFHHPSRVGNRFDTGKSEHNSYESSPVLPEASTQWLQMADRLPHVRQTEKREAYDHDGGRHGDKKRQAARMFRTEQVKQPNNQNGQGGELLRMRHAQILKGGKSADGGRDQIVRDQQKGADNGNDFTAMSHAGINSAAIGIKAADHHV